MFATLKNPQKSAIPSCCSGLVYQVFVGPKSNFFVAFFFCPNRDFSCIFVLYKLFGRGGQIQREGTIAGASFGGYTIGVKGAPPGAVPPDGRSRRPLEWTIDNCGVAGAVSPASNTRGGGIPGKYTIAGGWGASLNKPQNQ